MVKQEPGSEDVTWKKYVNEKYEFEFKYPSYFGEVVITNNFGECLTMKTYERNGVIDGADIFISFSNKPNVGKGGSHMEYYMTVFSNKKIDSTVCGVKLNDYKNSISQHSSTIFQQNNSVETYKSTIGTSMGTSVDIFYTLFSIKESNVTIIQSTAAFIPLFNSEELIEISKIEAEGDKQAIMTFVNKNIKANGVREKLIDFEEIVESIKFLN